MSKLQKRIEDLIKLGKRTGDMKLRNYARKALFGLLADDGTPGLWDGLWEEDIKPNLREAEKRAEYIHKTTCVVTTAKKLSQKRCMKYTA